jgi:hypothetical protein
MEENRLFLKLQIEEAQQRKDRENKELKEQKRTHFGPEENEYTMDMANTRQMNNKANMFHSLQK